MANLLQLSNSLPSATGLPGWATLWHLGVGRHPSLTSLPSVLSLLKPEALQSFLAEDGSQKEVLPEGLPLLAAHRGHHLLQDDAYLSAAGQTDTWALAPTYVRDLAGRILLTGLLPLPTPPELPLVPSSCMLLAAETPGMELLEKVFMLELRRLEYATQPGLLLDQPSSNLKPIATPTRLAAVYPAPHRYPYKLRLDSFYQDGFRLPQVARLYVQPASPVQARAAAQEFMQRWQQRPSGQDYDAFYDANSGAEWFETLFNQGCTIIPTAEAYNGWYQVTSDFGMADVLPGRVVPGLHEVVGQQPSELPQGTILAVQQPGYALRDSIVPAQVIVSDGSGWQPPYPNEPEPWLPDLTLPHPRVGGVWGDVWLPTHPGHFTQPAVWDWSATGHFVQVKGPLWDPLHYVYASTSKILRALRRTPQGPVLVPEELAPRFHPIIELRTYDTHNARTLTERRRALPEDHLLYGTALDALPLAHAVAQLGYHPLPPALEYELDPAVFPLLGPARFGAAPPTLRNRTLPVINSTLTAEQARQYIVLLQEPDVQQLLNPALYPASTGVAQEDYPYLRRGEKHPPAATTLAGWMPVFLPTRDQAELFPNLRRLFTRVGYRQQLTALHADLPAQLQALLEEAYAWRRRRYRAWRRFLPGLLQAWWEYQPLAMALGSQGIAAGVNGAENPDDQPAEDTAAALRALIVAQAALPQQPFPKGAAPKEARRLPVAQPAVTVGASIMPKDGDITYEPTARAR